MSVKEMAMAEMARDQPATQQDLDKQEARLHTHMASESTTLLRWMIGIGVTVALGSVGAMFALFQWVLLPSLH